MAAEAEARIMHVDAPDPLDHGFRRRSKAIALGVFRGDLAPDTTGCVDQFTIKADPAADFRLKRFWGIVVR